MNCRLAVKSSSFKRVSSHENHMNGNVSTDHKDMMLRVVHQRYALCLPIGFFFRPMYEP